MTKSSLNIDVSIIIVNYKSWHHLKNCLLALLQMNPADFAVEVVVVDNCSNDGKLAEFTNEFPQFKFIENTGNNGFANGCNFGAKHAGGEYLLFLNPDTIANEKAIQSMWTFAKKHMNVGIVSCHQKNTNGSYEKTVRLFPNIFTLFGLSRALHKLFCKSAIKNQYNETDSIIYPDWVSGSVLFISKEWYEQIQGWNEDYWMYYEDVDICKRVVDANGKIALLQDVEIIHNHGGASRINVRTAAITKTEVLISKHVYLNTHFTGIHHILSQFLVILNNLIFKTVMAVFGLVFFFIPKLRLGLRIYLKLMKYYINALFRGTWLSAKSLNY